MALKRRRLNPSRPIGRMSVPKAEIVKIQPLKGAEHGHEMHANAHVHAHGYAHTYGYGGHHSHETHNIRDSSCSGSENGHIHGLSHKSSKKDFFGLNKIFSKFKNMDFDMEDILLIALIIFFLNNEDEENMLIVLALVYIFMG